MRYRLPPIAFQLLHRVVQEEIDEYGIHATRRFRRVVVVIVFVFIVFVPLFYRRRRLGIVVVRHPALGMHPLNLLLDDLDAPDAGATKLNLPRRPTLDGLEAADMTLQRGRVPQAPEQIEHLGDAVVCSPTCQPKKGSFLPRACGNTYPQTW
jgi:hypothetical protein